MSEQFELVTLDELVSKDHNYRKFVEIFNFRDVKKAVKSIEKQGPYKGYGSLRLFKCLLLQFIEDLSDRELQRFIAENNSAKWFCGFSLMEKTPDYSVFSRYRGRLGAKKASKLFGLLRSQLQAANMMSEVFMFVDVSHLISKAALWRERDTAIKLKLEKL